MRIMSGIRKIISGIRKRALPLAITAATVSGGLLAIKACNRLDENASVMRHKCLDIWK